MIDQVKELIVPVDSGGERIDLFIAAAEGITRSAVAKLTESGRITVNGTNVAKNYKIRVNDVVIIDYPPMETSEAEAEDIALDIIYEDADIVVVNKPSGMVVHPAAGNPNGTLVNALLHH